MSNLPFKQPVTPDGYIKASGTGTSGDPWIVEQAVTVTGGATSANQTTIIGHVDGLEGLLTTIDADTGSIATAAAAIQAAAEAIQTAVEILDNVVAGSEAQVDVLTLPALAAGTNSIGGTKDNGPQWTSVFGVSGAVVTSADASTAVAVTDTPSAGQKLVITDIIVSVGATAMQVDLEEETTGTVIFTIYAAANTTYQITPRSKCKLATADKKLMVDTSAAGAISVTAFYHSEA